MSNTDVRGEMPQGEEGSGRTPPSALTPSAALTTCSPSAEASDSLRRGGCRGPLATLGIRGGAHPPSASCPTSPEPNLFLSVFSVSYRVTSFHSQVSISLLLMLAKL